ncbi:hypothetical protein WJX72_011549 [[Myrmecia] bisecta]|uniref:Uncharacterized protein n=1 Tax=[Myrmecia] bisecta TaxID=41462 RepID=A0AAW1QGJ9_9CHLO
MKARTKLLLQRAADKSGPAKEERQWTRFAFNSEALLDEEGAQPENGFHGDANVVSFRKPHAAATAEELQQAHEAAIFGASASIPAPSTSSSDSGAASDGGLTHPQPPMGDAGARESPRGGFDDWVGAGAGGGLGFAGLGAHPEEASPTCSPQATNAQSPEPEPELENNGSLLAAAAAGAHKLSWRERALLMKQQRAQQ